MFHAVVRILLKLFELIGCIACLIIKNLTDQEARRIAVRNQKFSREWSLLNNVTWSREGNAFASVTYGGYTLITALLLISRCINAKSRPTVTEKIFLTVGMLFFFTIGSLVYASIEQVPPDLYDNAIILGTLSYLVAILFLIDLADPMGRTINNFTQTENEMNLQYSNQTQTSDEYLSQNGVHKVNSHHTNGKELNIQSVHRVDVTPLPSPEVETIPNNGYYFTGDQVDIVQAKTLPTVQQPIFAKILLPEKKRPFREKIIKPIRLNHDEARLNYLHDEPAYRADARSHYYAHCNRDQCDQDTLPRKDYYTDDENMDRPIHSGFVAQAARMWDRRARKVNRKEFGTVV